MNFNGLFLFQDDKKFLYLNDLEIYFANLQHLYENLEQNDVQFLNFSFIALCSSTLEAALNQIAFEYYLNKFGPIEYKSYFESIINLSFKNKLYLLPTIVSDFKLKFNKNSYTLKKLEELIITRNKQLHKKPYIQQVEDDLEKLQNGDEFTFILKDNLFTVDKKNCKHYNNAIENFKNYFVIPFNEGKLQENEILTKI
ncbi:hypothetical protein ABEG63_12320 [Chryseobacterium sp. C39-AII1]|uniref:hypothetical protein n=1 Tax=Chryseobacterium sp. C39-AII1 TaxID=3080332 RepID=UPI00320BAFB3